MTTEDITYNNEGSLSSGNQAVMPSEDELFELRQAFNRINIPAPDIDKEWGKLRERIENSTQTNNNLTDNLQESDNSASSRAKIVSFLIGVAATLALVFIIHGLWSGSSRTEVFTADANSTDVILSSDDGQQRTITGEKLAFATHKEPTKIKKIRMMTISTPRGKDMQLLLPDGTKVVMNADSKIEFPEEFTGKERRIRVEGEAYFEVKKDPAHPFVAETDYFTTTVLGTTFNLRAYNEKDACITLISGKVKLSDVKSKENIDLSPGEQVVWSKEHGFDLSSVNVYPITQWKEGYFYFDNKPFVAIMQELGRWYNVNVVFEHPDLMNTKLHFVAERNEKIDSIVKRIKALEYADISFDNGTITIR